MKSSTDRILTTHVGSMPRPASLVALLMKRHRGQEYDQAELAKEITAAIEATVARQVKTGIDIVSDGENGKAGYSTYIKERLSGFTDAGYKGRMQSDFKEFPGLWERMMALQSQTPGEKRLSCTGPVALVDDKAVQTDIANFKAALKKAPAHDAFMNAVSPGTVAHFQPNLYYKTMEEYFEAVANAMRPEYEAIVAAGLVLQIDSPDLAMSFHSTFQDLGEKAFLKQAEMATEALNHALKNIPASSVRMHICWGNYEGPHTQDLPLETILPIVLKVKAQALSFEGANARHAHEWKVWKNPMVPADKILIPGMLDTTSNFVEHPELVAERIERYASVVGKERVMAGTDCGFSTFAGAGRVDPEVAFAKMGSLVKGAEIASKRLWK